MKHAPCSLCGVADRIRASTAPAMTALCAAPWLESPQSLKYLGDFQILMKSE